MHCSRTSALGRLACALAVCGSIPGVALAAPTEPGGLTNAITEATVCINCHSFGNVEPHQEDPLYAPWLGWRGSIMANSARDPVFWAGVAIASQDDPEGTEDCVRCHAPRAFLEGRGGAIAMDELTPPDLDGVECEMCHRTIEDLDAPLGNARYTIDDVAVNGMVPRRGPWTYDEGPDEPPHEWIQDAYIGSSRMCGTCHDVTTSRERVDDDGEGLGVPFNEQRTYSEWLGSAYAQPGEGFRSCQDCHMPAVTDVPGCFENANSGQTHPTGGRRHELVGANRFMLQLLQGLYGQQGTNAIDDFYYETSIENLDRFVATSATLAVEAPASVDLGEGMALGVTVTNESGHKLPSGYSEGRVMWISVVARLGDTVVWSSGAWDQARGLQEDPQLRTYRAIAEDYDDGATFHLLRNNHWVEDTRIPPRGATPDLQTDPVGERYVLQDDGTWPNFDVVAYDFAGDDAIVDPTPEDATDDVLDLEVSVLYLINTPEYVQFLADENRTNQAGNDVLTLFEDAGGATPVVLATQSIAVPISGFGGSVDTGTSSTSTSGGTPDTSASDPSATGPSPTSDDGTSNADTSTSGPGASEDGGGCSCDAGRSGGAAWMLPLGIALLGARRRRARR
jgi:MYXO-CTERM domain-containing protein